MPSKKSSLIKIFAKTCTIEMRKLAFTPRPVCATVGESLVAQHCTIGKIFGSHLGFCSQEFGPHGSALFRGRVGLVADMRVTGRRDGGLVICIYIIYN